MREEVSQTSSGQAKPKKKFVLRHHRSPGDSLVLSAALRTLHLTYPDEYEIGLDVTAGAELYQHNLDVVPIDYGEAVVRPIEYDAINRSNQTPVTFMEAFTEALAGIIERPLTLLTNRPHVVLSEDEKQWMGRVQEIAGQPVPYAVVNAGHKRDFTVKHWGFKNYQELVNRTKDRIQWVQVGTPNEVHQPLDGVINQIGKTSIRELIRLVYHARFCVGPTTLLQHVAASLQKPYVAILSGMEPLSWSSPYPTQVSLSSHGRLPCCRDRACWRARTVKLNDNCDQDKSLCALPMYNGAEFVPTCMAMVTVDRVEEAVTQLTTFVR